MRSTEKIWIKNYWIFIEDLEFLFIQLVVVLVVVVVVVVVEVVAIAVNKISH